MERKNELIIVVILTSLFIAVICPAVIAEDKNTDQVAQGGQTITILDDRGQYITIPYPVHNVVFLVENAMNSMYAVGGADRIAGIGNIWMFEKKEPFFRAIDPDFDSKPKITDTNGEVDLQALSQINPDLVVLWSADWNDQATTAIKEQVKVPVYGVYFTKLSDVSRAISVYAKMIGDESRESEVASIMTEYTKKVTDKTAGLQDSEKPTVYWMWGDIYGTAGINSASNELIRLAGGKNVIETADIIGKSDEHPVIDLDTLRKLNPDIIYLWYNEDVNPSDILRGEGEFSQWRDLKAVKSGRVYEVADPFVYDSFSPQQPLALMAIAKDVHPELFTDINLSDLIDSFFVKMYNVHYPSYSPA
ncbi:ABC transporter substrate-binding protein [uncultured Methanospirillum sp.]|uniref:ABC transporter substrate-binding protein n=1 Tax=uncultured Methanospirillum sp. TaxID=262503 RepID=UPI0029C80C17|nr:ABC transporter substrate-binding protein [uncultured Methanospirillum sp.]